MNWIKVSERLPEWGMIVLGYDAVYGHLCTAQVTGPISKRILFDDGIDNAVTHWIKLNIPKLPEPPNEK